MVDIRNIKLDSQPTQKPILPGEKSFFPYKTAATIAAATILALCGRYACVNDRHYSEQVQSQKPAVTIPSKLETTVTNEFVNTNNVNIKQSLKNHYTLADDLYYQGSKDRTKYQASIDSCTEALSLIEQNNQGSNYKDDFLYIRGRSKTHTGDLDGAVKDFLDSLTCLSSEKYPNSDQGINNGVNLRLYQLLSGKYKSTVKTSLTKHFGEYRSSEQQKILGNLWHDQKNAAYAILNK